MATTFFLSEPLLSGLTLSANTVLAGLATVLLLFVSLGVGYLSTVEWRDRRRRKAQEAAGRK